MNVIRYKPAVQAAPEIQHIAGENAFTVNNIIDGDLDVSSNQKQFDFSVLKGNQNGTVRVDYEPRDQEHVVSVKYRGQHVANSPFQLVPDFAADAQQQFQQLSLQEQQQQQVPVEAVQGANEAPDAEPMQGEQQEPQQQPQQQQQQQDPVKVDVDPSQQLLTVSNVPSFDDLDIDTSMAYKIYPGARQDQFRVKYEPVGIHDLSVNYDKQNVENFRFVPNHLRDVYEDRQQQLALEQAPAAAEKPCPNPPCPDPMPQTVGTAQPMPQPAQQQPQQVHPQQHRGQLLMSKPVTQQQTAFVEEVIEPQQDARAENHFREFQRGRLVASQNEVGKPMQMQGSAPRYTRVHGY